MINRETEHIDWARLSDQYCITADGSSIPRYLVYLAMYKLTSGDLDGRHAIQQMCDQFYTAQNKSH